MTKKENFLIEKLINYEEKITIGMKKGQVREGRLFIQQKKE